MKARASFLAAAAILLAAWSGLVPEAGAQPFGRAYGQRAAERGRERREERAGPRGEPRGEPRAEPRGDYRRGYGGDYRPPAYAPAPRYAYPAPSYAYPQAPPPAVYAAPAPPAYSYAAPGVRQGMAPLGSVMANIRRSTPGRMLDAWQEPGPDGRPAYRVRWAAQGGRRIDFIVDATTGAIIGQSGY